MPMQVTVSRRHTEVSEGLRVMAEEKIGRLGRFVDGLDHAEVHFWEHKNPRIAHEEVVVVLDGAGDELVDAGPQIVKSKRFAIHPMAADEAAERMELLGHGFFFFTNVETSRSAVVYRREDGNVGLIDEAD